MIKELRKGSLGLLKIGMDKTVLVCIIARFENEYMALIGESYKSEKKGNIVNRFFGRKYLNGTADLINFSSWNDENYNGVQYNTYLIPAELIKQHLEFSKNILLDNFYPRGSKTTIKNIEGLNNLSKDQKNMILKRIGNKNEYEIGYYDIFTDYKKKDN